MPDPNENKKSHTTILRKNSVWIGKGDRNSSNFCNKTMKSKNKMLIKNHYHDNSKNKKFNLIQIIFPNPKRKNMKDTSINFIKMKRSISSLLIQ